MAIRDKNEELEKIRSENFVYSISRLNAIDGCLLEAYYTYKECKRGLDSVYGILGGAIHDGLEIVYNGGDSSAIKEKLDTALNLCDKKGVKFPKDFRGNDTIRNNWIADIEHFCANFEKLDGEFETEQLFIYKTDTGIYTMGYIDLINHLDKEKKIVDIYDFKTSTKFLKDDLKHHGRQLVLYGIALESEGYTVRSINWIMLKYVEVKYQGYKRANSKTKSEIIKVIQRSKLAKELASVVENKLYEAGFDEIETEIYLDNFKETNDINVLPNEIKTQFTINQYIQPYEFSDENKKEVLNYVYEQAMKFEALWDKPKSMWSPVEINEKNSFYCNNLCGQRERCENLQKYNLLLQLNKTEDTDLF